MKRNIATLSLLALAACGGSEEPNILTKYDTPRIIEASTTMTDIGMIDPNLRGYDGIATQYANGERKLVVIPPRNNPFTTQLVYADNNREGDLTLQGKQPFRRIDPDYLFNEILNY